MAGDHSKFGVLILTHGRPTKEEQRTWRSLQKAHYKGPIWWVVDNEDPTADQLRELVGPERVIEFDKAAEALTFDTADTSTDRQTIVYARNASQRIARDLGLDYFLMLDDDYNYFAHRYVDGTHLPYAYVTDLDAICEAMLTFLDDTQAATVAFAQGGDYFGGASSFTNPNNALKRKAMNTFFLDTSRPVEFVGRINEDVNTFLLAGSRGELFFTVWRLGIDQGITQTNAGGMTGTYLEAGTYVKSFYSVMMCPSFVRISKMGRNALRFHHTIRWDHAVPKILSGRHRKTP